VNPIWREKPVINSLPQTVSVDWITKISVAVPILFAQWRGGHTKLIGWLEVFKDFAPITFIAGAAAVTFVNDD
jgi:hypothetical protein